MPVTISELAFGLIIAEGQLEDAIKEERRWNLREQEAAEMRLNARASVARWQKIITKLKNKVSES